MLWLPLFLLFVIGCDRAQGTPPPNETTKETPIEAPKKITPTLVKLYEKDLQPKYDLPASLKKALLKKNVEPSLQSLKKLAAKNPDLDFLLAYQYTKSQNPKRAIPLLARLRSRTDVPNDYLQFTIGNILHANKKYLEAAKTLQQIPKESLLYMSSQLHAIEAFEKAGKKEEANLLLNKLAKRSDPMEKGADVLYKLAKKNGLESPKSYPYLRRIWTQYPTSKIASTSKVNLEFHEQRNPKNKASSVEKALRIKRLMEKKRFKRIRNELQAFVAKPHVFTKENCLRYYAYGRSLYKANQVTDAAKLLKVVGEKCKEKDPDSGARSLYVAGKSLERKKNWLGAAIQYEKIPRYYPQHSMADDGYTLAGISHQESGNKTRALAMWKKQVETYPEGDMLAEGYWRWAWHTFLIGNTPKAIKIAEQSQAVVPLKGDPVHAMALRYWGIRWKLYPSKSKPQKRNPDAKAFAAALEELEQFCKDHPTRFYALLAAQRIYELDKKKAQQLPRPKWKEAMDHWEVEQGFLDNKKLQKAMQLNRLGLFKEAYQEIKSLEAKNPTEKSVLVTFRKPMSWIASHDDLHRFLNKHPPATYQANHKRILLQAYPNKYFDLTKSVTTSYSFDPRIFHSLVREESSFNPKIVSWAGARGLSQLMPRTARSVATKKFGIRIRLKDLFQPKLNLQLGSRYFSFLMGMFQKNPFLAVPSYNAGQGNMKKWLASKGNLPTDAFVETIPIRETRAYVKRVMGTYQIYRSIRHSSALYPNWSRYNHKAQPGPELKQ